MIFLFSLLFEFYLLNLSSSSDIGQIGYFTDSCPEGWMEFTPARNRNWGYISFRKPGGSISVTCNNENLPPHYHFIFGAGRVNGRLDYHPYEYPRFSAGAFVSGSRVGPETYEYNIQATSEVPYRKK